MSALEQLFEQIKDFAAAHDMDAFVAGSRSRQDDGSLRRTPLLKISPRGVRTLSLLQVSSEGGRFTMHAHRSSNLTGIYQGRTIDEKWIRAFIEQNQSRAQTIISERAKKVEGSPRPSKSERLPVPREERRKREAERHTVNCSCLGEVENCARCFGKGFYTADGSGNPV